MQQPMQGSDSAKSTDIRAGYGQIRPEPCAKTAAKHPPRRSQSGKASARAVRSDSSHLANRAAKCRGQLVAPNGFAVECRPPFDKGAVAVRDLRDAYGRQEIHRSAARADRRTRSFANVRGRTTPGGAAGRAAPDKARSGRRRPYRRSCRPRSRSRRRRPTQT